MPALSSSDGSQPSTRVSILFTEIATNRRHDELAPVVAMAVATQKVPSVALGLATVVAT